MTKNRTVIVLIIFGITIVLAGGYIFQSLHSPNLQSDVKGAQVIDQASHVPTQTPTATLTPSTLPTSKLFNKKIPLLTVTPSTSAKQKGGWYWNSELKKSQVWLGVDGAGNDIWADSFPEPTATPTPYQIIRSGGTTNTVINTFVP